MIECSEHMNYHKIMKIIDNYIENLKGHELMLQKEIMEVQIELKAYQKTKEVIHEVWLKDHPDNGG